MKNGKDDNLLKHAERAINKYRVVSFFHHNFFVNTIRWCKRRLSAMFDSQKKKVLFDNKQIMAFFLESGLYTFSFNKIKETKKRIKSVYIENVTDKYVLSKSAKIIFGEWTEKTIVLFDNYVLSVYPELHLPWVENIDKFVNEINYPKCDFFEINKKELFTVCSVARGVISYDPKRILKVCSEILRLNEKTQMVNYISCEQENIRLLRRNDIKDDFICGYVQHGDMAVCNIIWENSDSFRLIDFDLVDVYPALYDLLCLLTYEYVGIFGLMYYINGYFDAEIKKLFAAAGSDLEIYKDKYLAIFLCLHPLERINNRKFLKKIIPKSYSITWGVLDKQL